MPKLTPLQIDMLSGISAALAEDEIIARLSLTKKKYRQELSDLLAIIVGLDEQGRLEITEQVARHQLDVVQDELQRRTRRKKKK